MASYFSVEMGSHKLFVSGWLQTVISPISASHVTRLIGVSHQSPATFSDFFCFFYFFFCVPDIYAILFKSFSQL
jgi:hypothetical protein